MKLCDRCKVPDCPMGYLTAGCANARKMWCPDVQPNRAEIISNMSLDEMAHQLLPMIEELCEDGIPSPEYMKMWLEASPEGFAAPCVGETVYALVKNLGTFRLEVACGVVARADSETIEVMTRNTAFDAYLHTYPASEWGNSIFRSEEKAKAALKLIEAAP